MNKLRIALITVNETRDRFRELRQPLVDQELEAVSWIREIGEVYTSPVITGQSQIASVHEDMRTFNPHLFVMHIPVWTEPSLTVKLVQGYPDIPVILLGNQKKETSSMVGLFGAGGSLDQAGIAHTRIFNHYGVKERAELFQMARAAYVIKELKGSVYGQFGGRSLGMVTAISDPAQWSKTFGVDSEHLDQILIMSEAERFSDAEVNEYISWLEENSRGISYDELFDKEALRKQVRSYLATEKLMKDRSLDFIGVKCQPELGDLYTTQCLSHMLMNSSHNRNGEKVPVVHACEADADGALTMQILKLISGGKATALLDMRWQNPENGLWTLANCGAMAGDFAASEADPTGLSSVEVMPHIIGCKGGCALPFMAKAQHVTMARLCRRDGAYTMFILSGDIQDRPHEALKEATACFPQAYIDLPTDDGFLADFGSNHLHMVSGDFTAELEMYCKMSGLDCKVWIKE